MCYTNTVARLCIRYDGLQEIFASLAWEIARLWIESGKISFFFWKKLVVFILYLVGPVLICIFISIHSRLCLVNEPLSIVQRTAACLNGWSWYCALRYEVNKNNSFCKSALPLLPPKKKKKRKPKTCLCVLVRARSLIIPKFGPWQKQIKWNGLYIVQFCMATHQNQKMLKV